MTYIVLDRLTPEWDFFDSLDEAMANAKERIAEYLDELWPDDMDGAIVVAQVVSESTMVNVVTRDMLDDNGCCNGRHYSGTEAEFWCDYVMPDAAITHRCNICGGLVQFDGTPPATEIK